MMFIEELKKLNLKQLENHFNQIVNNIKNVSSDYCFIYKNEFRKLVNIFDGELSKVVTNQIDKTSLEHLEESTKLNNITNINNNNNNNQKKLDNIISSNNNNNNNYNNALVIENDIIVNDNNENNSNNYPTDSINKNNIYIDDNISFNEQSSENYVASNMLKGILSPLKVNRLKKNNASNSNSKTLNNAKDKVNDNYIAAENSIYSNIVPVEFDGLIKHKDISAYNHEDLTELLDTLDNNNKDSTQIDTNRANLNSKSNTRIPRRKRINVDSLTDPYPFREEKGICIIY